LNDHCLCKEILLLANMSAEVPQVDVAAAGDSANNNAVEAKPKCKPCCACPETRKARDACIAENGEEGCADLIEAHKQCMIGMGFKI